MARSVVVLFACIVVLFSILSVVSALRTTKSNRSDMEGVQQKNQNGTGYAYWCVGNCDTPKKGVNTLPGIVLMGGGVDVDKAFLWMIKRSGGGDFVIIRAYGTDAYNPYVWQLANGAINSVSTILTTSREGTEQDFVIEKILGASALFIAGGDQWTYMQQWNNTRLSQALQTLIKSGITIGGTSAGMAVQPQWIFTAATGGVSSQDALDDPYSKDVTIGTGFLKQKFLENVITDTHFVQRNRMGRLVVFLARLIQDDEVSSYNAKGIASDQQTAVLVDENGMGTVVSDLSPGQANYAYFLETTELPYTCEPGRSLSISNVNVTRVGPGGTFDLAAWQPGQDHVKSYTLNVDDGYLSSSGNDGHIY